MVINELIEEMTDFMQFVLPLNYIQNHLSNYHSIIHI